MRIRIGCSLNGVNERHDLNYENYMLHSVSRAHLNRELVRSAFTCVDTARERVESRERGRQRCHTCVTDFALHTFSLCAPALCAAAARNTQSIQLITP